MIALTLAEIASAVDGEVRPADAAATVVDGAVETDSREIAPGGIFVARLGEAMDGHDFAASAVERGAALLVVERPLDLDVPQVVVRDSTVALAALAKEVVARVRAGGRLRVVGITGSNGKTTTKNLLREILGRIGPTVASHASFNNEVGGPMTMLRITHDTAYLVAEMGASAAGDIARLVRLAKPDVGVVLKVGLAHAGGFGSIEGTQRAKSEMVTDLEPTDVAVLNRDDPRVAAMADVTKARVAWFGLAADPAEGGTTALDVEASSAGTTFELVLPGGERRAVSFRVLGEHHVSNAMAAAAAATALGVDADTVVAGLEAVVRAERWRMEVLVAEPLTIVNDAYNASPDSMAAALKALVQIAPGRSVAVLGAMTELGESAGEEHDRIGLLVVRLNIGQLVVVGPDAKRIHLAAVAQGSWDGESVFAETQEEAEALLADVLRPGDTVLVKSSNAAGLRHLGDRLGARWSGTA
ncbi:UDP-N-acetylmuramoyl-tripeptide--D-alanyl-D-alanine ligase [Amnibacterium kyonggiense]|uniref:UDP-N-acetylmuramoyl-tripeptide--D-alanyl-D-alanine ligase n=1 Tax=Amnibacterium kyonggiense TaxID=595671 RepID=A0A4R7FKW4_9MICO|nr:UDP-N-acetylmuramoyl-tripeptide--D-alanyl-D-alanine ligase [Amnibacterium kyonggiense]TDS77020.1 UDP-N-acetylmuramoyl-tripeptide--D-alanyl-D-alanine ligase [Amnibacterium kyonggiense]